MVKMMILHTIINEGDIFSGENKLSPTEFLSIKGGILEYKNNNGRKEAVRLISTDPYMYLNSTYSPYSDITGLKGYNDL